MFERFFNSFSTQGPTGSGFESMARRASFVLSIVGTALAVSIFAILGILSGSVILSALLLCVILVLAVLVLRSLILPAPGILRPSLSAA